MRTPTRSSARPPLGTAPLAPLPAVEELSSFLAGLRARGQVEVREDGALLAGLVNPEHEVRGQSGRLVLHLWSGDATLVRRIEAVLGQSEEGIEFAVQKFGTRRPGRLELRSRDVPLDPGRVTREQFRPRFRELLAGQFPDEEVLSLTASPDLKRSLSGNYARGVQARGREAWAIVGVPPTESAASTDAALACGLLWLVRARELNPRKRVAGLRLFLPEGSSAVTRHRMQALGRDLLLELYECDWSHGRVNRVDPADGGNLDSRLVARREVELLREEAKRAAHSVLPALLQGLESEAGGRVDVVVVPGTRAVSWRFRGLEFARYEAGVLSAVDEHGNAAAAAARPELISRRLNELRAFRRPEGPDAHHPLYRAQAERWLESLIAGDPARIDPRLDSRFLYAQVPAFSFTDRAVLDLLGATRDGRLVVIELKANEDLQLLPQALDYWLRVRWHREQGDLESLGYFAGLPLGERPPLLYLVAPGLRFHPATETLLRFVAPEVEVIRVGLNENWRQGVRVLFRQERQS